MSGAYTCVGDANSDCAFIESNGLDVATLHRLHPDEVGMPQHKAACLSDDQWQAVIDLVNAAPQLLEALQDALALIVNGPARCDDDPEIMLEGIRAAIAQATGGAS